MHFRWIFLLSSAVRRRKSNSERKINGQYVCVSNVGYISSRLSTVYIQTDTELWPQEKRSETRYMSF